MAAEASTSDSGQTHTGAWAHPFAVIHDDPKHEPPACVAVLPRSEGADDPLLVARVAAVHRRLSAAAVPHVLPILAALQRDDGLHLVHRRVEAHPLAAVLRRGPLPLARTLAILRRLCATLVAAQRLGVDHRALGPASVLLGDGDQLWIADFGVADLFARDRPSGELSLVPTTPEQISGGATASSEDVYLLGCLAYWMLGGTPVFQADSLATLRRRHAIEDPPALRARGIPASLRQAIARALEKDPDDRFADLEAFDAMLARAEHEAGISCVALVRAPVRALATRQKTAPIRARRRVHPFVWTSLGALAVTLSLAFAGSSEPTSVARPPTVVLSAIVASEEPLPPIPGPVAPVAAPLPEPPEALSPTTETITAPTPEPVALSIAPMDESPPFAEPVVTLDEDIAVEAAERSPGRDRPRESTTPACEHVRREATEAREAHDWRGLLHATAKSSCWKSRRSPAKLRVKALMELRMFDDCAAAVARADGSDRELTRWGELCRRRNEATG